MSSVQTNLSLLVPVGNVLLLGSFAFTLVKAMRGVGELQTSFERLAIGFLGLTFYRSGAASLVEISESLTSALFQMGNPAELKQIVLDAFRKASEDNGRTQFNIPAMMEQAWRTGVWGIMTMVVDGAFMIVSFLLECAKEVLWTLLLVLFPVAAGVYPILPKMMTNLIVYGLELSLWFPILCLVEIITGSVAQKYMMKAGSWGLYVVAVEIIAILLILLIPSMTHRFLSGAFSGDFDSSSGVIKTATRLATRLKIGA